MSLRMKPRPRYSRPLVGATLGATIGIFALAPVGTGAQEVERFSLSGDVAIFNIAGAVQIERGTSGGVVVELRRGGGDAERLRVQTGQIEGWQTLRVIYPENHVTYPRLQGRSRTQFDVTRDGTFGRKWTDTEGFNLRTLLRMTIGEGSRNRMTVSSSGRGLEAYADLRVVVPPGRTVAIHLGVGEVEASNVDGNLLVDARAASITAHDLRGSVRLATGSGRIELDGAQGDVVLDTGSGNINVANVTGDKLSVDTGSGRVTGSNVRSSAVDVDTGSGSVTLSGVRADRIGVDTGSGSIRLVEAEAADLDLDTGSGSISVDLLSRLQNARIDTGSGTVTLTVPADLGATLNLSTGSGGISTDLPVQIQEQRRTLLRGRVGDGSGRISIETGSGGIRIRSR